MVPITVDTSVDTSPSWAGTIMLLNMVGGGDGDDGGDGDACMTAADDGTVLYFLFPPGRPAHTHW